MKFFAAFVLSLAFTAVLAQPVTDEDKQLEKATNAVKLDMKEVEKLLAEIEAHEQKPKDPTVSESVNKLFATFRQVTSAYINVLNAVNKSLGLPKYPTIPGLGREARQSQDSNYLPVRQITDNLKQLRDTAVEVGNLVRRVVSNMSEDSRKTVLNQFHRFTDMWSKQLNEISQTLQQAANDQKQSRQDGPMSPSRATIFDQINRYIQQVSNSMTNFANNIVNGIRNRITPTSPSL